jgi:hypothetical protein
LVVVVDLLYISDYGKMLPEEVLAKQEISPIEMRGCDKRFIK